MLEINFYSLGSVKCKCSMWSRAGLLRVTLAEWQINVGVAQIYAEGSIRQSGPLPTSLMSSKWLQ